MYGPWKKPTVCWAKLTSSTCTAANLWFNCEALCSQAALIPYTTNINCVYVIETQAGLLFFFPKCGVALKDKILDKISRLQENLHIKDCTKRTNNDIVIGFSSVTVWVQIPLFSLKTVQYLFSCIVWSAQPYHNTSQQLEYWPWECLMQRAASQGTERSGDLYICGLLKV